MKSVPYAQVMGILMYVMTNIKHDICYAIGLISMFQIQSN
jgi:nicotinamide riboside transporter PnuC